MLEPADYLNARLRGRKSRFLGPEKLRELSRLDSVEELRKQLTDTLYGPHLSRLGYLEKDTALLIERAVGETLREDLKAVRGFSPELSASPASFLFSRWDAWNMKAVARGLHSHESAERIQGSLVQAGWVEEAVWREIASSRTLREGAERALLLGVLSAGQLRESFGEDRRYRSEVASLEDSVDRRFYREALRGLEEKGEREEFWSPALLSLREEIDAKNLKTVLLALASGEPREKKLTIPGGAWTVKLPGEPSSSEKARQVLAQAVRKRYKAAGESLARVIEEENYLRAAALTAKISWRRQMRFISGNPLSSAILVGYLWTRAAEAVDLRLILWGVNFGMGRERIGEELIIAGGGG
ncbi:hypothetical protein EPN96_02570 [bacterium]|nr:MAG: hypothetical protein EPN96_02570 [bacterium]